MSRLGLHDERIWRHNWPYKRTNHHLFWGPDLAAQASPGGGAGVDRAHSPIPLFLALECPHHAA